MKSINLILLILFTFSCNSQKPEATETDSAQLEKAQIGQFVVDVFRNSKGFIWFGTIEKGVAKYDGSELKYYTTDDGLPSNRVVSIEEDNQGNMWFGTGMGLSKYDGETFHNYDMNDGLCDDRISKLLIDSQGVIWIGTWNGVCKFDGANFVTFPIPEPKVETQINKDTKSWVTDIIEDSKGNIWFGKDGFGACKFNGESFEYVLKVNGLLSNNITSIEEDQNGDVWFGTRVAEKDNPNPDLRVGEGGVNKMANDLIHSFPENKVLNHSDVYEIYSGNSGLIWICTTNDGVFKYDGEQFINYDIPISIMGIDEDILGNLWLGGAGGLYRIDKNENIINVTVGGPWN